MYAALSHENVQLLCANANGTSAAHAARQATATHVARVSSTRDSSVVTGMVTCNPAVRFVARAHAPEGT